MLKMEGRRTEIRTADGQDTRRCKACLQGTVNETMQTLTEHINEEGNDSSQVGFQEYVRGLRPFVNEFG